MPSVAEIGFADVFVAGDLDRRTGLHDGAGLDDVGLVGELESLAILERADPVEGVRQGAGRPSAGVRIAADGPYVIAVDLGVDRAVVARVGAERTWLFGFSQGACLAAEAFARSEHRLGGLVAPAGARIGAPGEAPSIARSLEGSVVLLGASLQDPFLQGSDIAASADAFRAAGATVHRIDGAGDAHQRSRSAIRVMPNEIAKMMTVSTTAMAAADPTRPCWKARL